MIQIVRHSCHLLRLLRKGSSFGLPLLAHSESTPLLFFSYVPLNDGLAFLFLSIRRGVFG